MCVIIFAAKMLQTTHGKLQTNKKTEFCSVEPVFCRNTITHIAIMGLLCLAYKRFCHQTVKGWSSSKYSTNGKTLNQFCSLQPFNSSELVNLLGACAP